jgi:hypothetical protein
MGHGECITRKTNQTLHELCGPIRGKVVSDQIAAK